MDKTDFNKIAAKWQQRWEKAGIFKAKDEFCLKFLIFSENSPWTSGNLLSRENFPLDIHA